MFRRKSADWQMTGLALAPQRRGPMVKGAGREFGGYWLDALTAGPLRAGANLALAAAEKVLPTGTRV